MNSPNLGPGGHLAQLNLELHCWVSQSALVYTGEVLQTGRSARETSAPALRARPAQRRLPLGDEYSPPKPKRRCAFLEGFSLHANTRVHENDRGNLRRLCAYGARGPLTLEGLSWLPDGRLAYCMKRPAASGQTELVLVPVDFLRRPAALVPPPRVNLVRFFGFFAPNASLRKHLVPKPPKQDPSVPAASSPAATPATSTASHGPNCSREPSQQTS